MHGVEWAQSPLSFPSKIPPAAPSITMQLPIHDKLSLTKIPVLGGGNGRRKGVRVGGWEVGAPRD